MILADALVEALKQLGVTHVFGVSGANIEAFHDALLRLASADIESLLCKSERGASFMADGYARQTGNLAVCCSTSGGGMVNLAVGLAESRNTGVPVLAIVGCPPNSLAGLGAFQDASPGIDRVNAKEFFTGVSKYCAYLSLDNFWSQLNYAIQVATSGFKGPSVLLVPSDRFAEPVAASPESMDWRTEEPPIVVPTLASLKEKLLTAQRPLLIAGPDVAHNCELQNWCLQQAIPVATTMEASAAFPHNHPCFIGLLGVAGHSNVHRYLMDCDLLIVLGSRLEIMTRGAAKQRFPEVDKILCHRSLEGVSPDGRTTAIQCDPNRFIPLLAECGPKLATTGLTPFTKPERVQLPHDEEPAALLSNSNALYLVQDYLSYFNQFVFDAGNCAAAAAHYLALPDSASAHIALGMGGMGYAIAASIGMRLAEPNGHSLVVCGDGAFLMEGMELHTAVELQLPILYLIFNDSQHGMCVSRQRHFYDSRITCTRYNPVHFTELVRGLAGDSELFSAEADDVDSFRRSLDSYFSQPKTGPGVIELVIKREEIPPFFPLNPAVKGLSVA